MSGGPGGSPRRHRPRCPRQRGHHRGHPSSVSPHLLYELQAVLSREKFRRYLTITEMREYLLWMRDRAMVVEIVGQDVVTGFTPDPGNDYLIAATIGSAAEVLVSGDSHLLDLETDTTSGVSTTIVTPREFLEQMKRSG